MGLIKALTSSVSSSLGDQFKEYVTCPEVDNNVLVARGEVHHGKGNSNPTEGVISNGSTIAVPEGMAMMIVDNGKIAELSAEAGTYTWDTSSEPSIFTGGLGKGIVDTIKTIGKRITYGGQAAKDQRVYFVNIKTIPGNLFGSQQPELFDDPKYGDISITYNGQYAIRIDDPAILVSNVIGSNPKDILTFDDVFATDGQNMLKRKFIDKIGGVIQDLLYENNISVSQVNRGTYKDLVVEKMNTVLDEEWKSKYGVVVEDVTFTVNLPQELRDTISKQSVEINAVKRMGEAYSENMSGTMAAATAEAMKNASKNDNGAMMGFAGMNMASNAGANLMGAIQTPNNNANVTNDSIPAGGANFCPNCGTKTTGANFCSNCGHKLN